MQSLRSYKKQLLYNMTRLNRRNVLRILAVCLLSEVVQTKDIAYMDRQTRGTSVAGCGDTIEYTLSGQVSSYIPAYQPNLNCSLVLYSPPGTRLSLTVTDIRLVNGNLNTCISDNRLQILGSNMEGAMSLLPTFPNGLCGYVKPSQTIESTDNRVFLILTTIESTAENTFDIRYTAFKTEPDGECFECDVSSGSRNTPFCINQSLVCDGDKNCPGTSSEETTAVCAITTPVPENNLSLTFIVIIVILAIVLLAVIIFFILAIVAKRAHSKRNQGSVTRPQRVSQSGMAPRDVESSGRDRQQPRPTSDFDHNYSRQVPSGAPMFTTEGERCEFLDPRDVQVGQGMNPTAPPPYSTFPRPLEHSLQIAEGTTPISRSRLASSNDDL